MKSHSGKEDFPEVPVPSYPGDAVLDRQLAICGWQPSASVMRRNIQEIIAKGQGPQVVVQKVCEKLGALKTPEGEAQKLLACILALWNQVAREMGHGSFN